MVFTTKHLSSSTQNSLVNNIHSFVIRFKNGELTLDLVMKETVFLQIYPS